MFIFSCAEYNHSRFREIILSLHCAHQGRSDNYMILDIRSGLTPFAHDVTHQIQAFSLGVAEAKKPKAFLRYQRYLLCKQACSSIVDI